MSISQGRMTKVGNWYLFNEGSVDLVQRKSEDLYTSCFTPSLLSLSLIITLISASSGTIPSAGANQSARTNMPGIATTARTAQANHNDIVNPAFPFAAPGEIRQPDIALDALQAVRADGGVQPEPAT